MQLRKYCPCKENVQELLELTFEMKHFVETEQHITLEDVDLSDFALITENVFSDVGRMLVRN